MNAKVSRTPRKLKWLAALAVLVLVAGVAQAVEIRLIPEDLTVPIYIRGCDDVKTGWTATIFYHPPECVPNNYNLLTGADYNISPKCPLLVEGFTLWEEGAAIPFQVVLDNAPGTRIPIYFTKLTEIYAAIADGKITVKDLEQMDSRLVGMADSYHEVYQPLDANGNYQLDILASGTLADGRSFHLHWEANSSNYNVTVRFGK